MDASDNYKWKYCVCLLAIELPCYLGCGHLLCRGCSVKMARGRSRCPICHSRSSAITSLQSRDKIPLKQKLDTVNCYTKCPICLFICTSKDLLCSLKCGHTFCKRCIKSAHPKPKHCFICRSPYSDTVMKCEFEGMPHAKKLTIHVLP